MLRAMRIPPHERVLSRCERVGSCLLFRGSLTPGGYGHVTVAKGRNAPAHRIVYEALVGPIPPKHDLHHLCPNRACVEPTHVEPILHRIHPAMHKVERTHCSKGHPFDEANTYNTSAGARQCRACHRDRERARRVRDPSSSL
jgi:hypothetical protein